jgi:hypothetical protein
MILQFGNHFRVRRWNQRARTIHRRGTSCQSKRIRRPVLNRKSDWLFFEGVLFAVVVVKFLRYLAETSIRRNLGHPDTAVNKAQVLGVSSQLSILRNVRVSLMVFES